MSKVDNVKSIKDINFNTLNNTYNVYLESDLYQIEDNGKDLNLPYFLRVYKKAIEVFDDIFKPKEQIKLLHSISNNNKSYRRTRFSKKYLSKQVSLGFQYEQINTSSDLIEVNNVYTYICQKRDIRYKKLIKSICNQDFPSLTPNINQGATFSSIYFINISKGILFYLYDDRGFVIAFDNIEDFEKFKKKHKELEIEKYNETEI